MFRRPLPGAAMVAEGSGRTLHSERRVLRHMSRKLKSSDPGLALLFVNFTQLTHGEELPGTERLRARRSARWPQRRGTQLRMVFFFTLLMVMLVACWALAMVSTSGAHRHGPAAPKQQLSGASSSCADQYEPGRLLAQLGSKPTSAAPC
jgi:Protein of unknown function (DUF3040)